MITKELLKEEIDNIKKDEYLVILYRIIKALAAPIKKSTQVFSKAPAKADKKSEWHKFIQETYGCLASTKIKRGEQSAFEVREAMR